MSAPRRLRKVHANGELRAVVDETIAFFHRLRWVAEQIYGDDGRSTARRGVLRGLARYGPQTVPQLARARSVSRQNIRPIVDSLAARELVEFVDNPAHARSQCVRITAEGQAIVKRMDETDRRVLLAVGRDLPRSDLETTVATLRTLRTRFETSMRWRPAIKSSKEDA